jgi:hypothetical protein
MERLKAAYYRLPPGVRARIPFGLETWVRETALPFLRGSQAAKELEKRLWGGFSRDARAGLAALLADPATPRREAAEAALALAR